MESYFTEVKALERCMPRLGNFYRARKRPHVSQRCRGRFNEQQLLTQAANG